MDFISRLDRDRASSIIGIVAAITLVYSSLSIISERKKSHKKIPMPGSSYPYVGHLLSLGEYPTHTLTKWHKELGPVIQLKMGVQRWVSINDPFLAQELFGQKGVHTSLRTITKYGKYYGHDGQGIFFSNGKNWKRAREALLTVLAPKMVDQYMDKIEFESNELVERLLKTTREKGCVYPTGDLQLLSLNVISHVTVGKRYESREDPEFKAIIAMTKRAIKLAAFENDIPSFLPLFSFLTFVSDVEKSFADYVEKERDPIIGKLINDATVSSDVNVMKALDSETLDVSPIEKLVILSDVIMAGEDTTETTLGWALAILCHYPDVQKQMQKEIDEFMAQNGGNKPKFSQRTQLPYTCSVMKECMRYRSITAFGVPRETSEDVELDGYIIPKGTTVLTCMKAMHENPKAYDNPEKFIAERFVNDQKSMYASANGRVADRDHYNFGFGRRICPGIYLAEVEIFNAYISIFSKCTIEPILDEENNVVYPDIDHEQNSGVIVAPAPFYVKVVNRTDV